MKNTMKRIGVTTFLMMVTIMSPYGVYAQPGAGPLDKLFNGLRNVLLPVTANKTVILSVIGLIGLILGMIAFGSDLTSNSPQLTKVIKGFVAVLIFIEVVFFFIA